MITEKQLELLKQYKDKSYINSLLAEQSYNYYVFIKNGINIPLIITNSAMVVINAVIQDEALLKVLNIILNSSTGLILSLISNFKIYENIQNFHQIQIKYNKLSHQIDTKLTNDLENINADFITSVIDDYDQIIEAQEYSFPSNIKYKIKKQYENKLTLPASLSVDIVEICQENKCCIKV
jgi:hypothetical protein